MSPSKPIIEAPFMNYFMLAADAHSRMDHYIKKDGVEWPPFGKFHESAIGQATVVLVFVIMTLESFINNYAARKMGRNFAKKELKNMGLYKKWSFVPERITGLVISDNDKGMQMLKRMIAMRNFLIHTKSGQIEWEDFHSAMRKRKMQTNKWEIELVNIGREAFDCIGLLGQLLLSADSDEPFAIMFSRLVNK